MKKTIGWSLAGLSTLGIWATSLQAVTWTNSGLPAPGVSTVSSLTDYDNVQFGSIVSDSAGRIFVAMQTVAGASGTAGGKVAIYTPSGGGAYGVPVIVDLTTSGPVTKLVVAGTGAFEGVYGLQNWGQMSATNGSSGLVSQIIRINPGGTVDTIFKMDGATLYGGSATPPTEAGKRLYGMTVGGSPDFSVFFTNDGSGNTGKNNYTWKFDVTQPFSFASNPSKVGTGNNGFSETQREFNIEYVGREGANDYIAVIGNQTTVGSGSSSQNSAWYPDTIFTNITGATNRTFNGAYSSAVAGALPGYRDWITATAYDSASSRRNLWIAGRGTRLNVAWAGSTPVGNGGITSGYRSGFIVDLGGGNYGMRSLKNPASSSTTIGNYPYWKRAPGSNGFPASAGATVAARFKVDAISQATSGPSQYLSYLLRAAGNSTTAGVQTPRAGITVRWDGTNNRLKLWNIGGITQLADLGILSVGTNTFYEIGLYVTAVNASGGTVRCWLNGSEIAGSPFTVTNLGADGGEASFGAGATTRGAEQIIGDMSTADVVFDWVGTDASVVAPPYSPASFRTAPLGPTSLNVTGPDGILACYLEGNVLPEFAVASNNATRWTALPGNPSAFFTGSAGAGVQTPATTWNVNANPILPDGANFTAGSNVINGGRFWLTAMAVNPCDGAAWTSFGGEQSDIGHYTPNGSQPFMAEGKAYTIGAAANTLGGDEGAPLAVNTSQIMALYFMPPSGKTVLALAADKTTGVYGLYKAGNPGACCNNPPADVSPGTLGGGTFGDGSVDMNDFAVFQRCYKSSPLDTVCVCVDFDHSGAVDDVDMIKFVNCTPIGGKGTGVLANPNCAN
jgi:hypothetical protein